jgi:hypothetical protein
LLSQIYATGKENVLLNVGAIAVWIFNAILYAIVICLTYYYVVGPTFKDYGLYDMGTVVFIGMIMSLQAKVSFYHHQWAYPHVISMILSMILVYIGYIILSVGVYDYYYVAIVTFGRGLFWFYGFWSMPIFTMFIDWLGYYTRMMFWPTREMLYREMDLLEQEKQEQFAPQNNVRGIEIAKV